jgi:uncharacterized protein YjbI with pentapeptide repeats
MSYRQAWLECGFLIALAAACRADIYRWDNGQLIPGTEGITPGPGAQFENRVLEFANLSEKNLTNAFFNGANLTGAQFESSNLTNADFTGAIVRGAILFGTVGFTKEQLYSTASYQAKDLQGIGLHARNLAGWDFSGQNLRVAGLSVANLTSAELTGANLTNASLGAANLTGAKLAGANLTDAYLSEARLAAANISGAILRGADFWRTTSRGFTRDQLYSTASYRLKDLREIRWEDNDLTGWDFTGQDLTDGSFAGATVRNTNLTSAIVTNVNFGQARGFAKEQLYLHR